MPNQIIVRRTAAIGDSLAASVVATKLHELGSAVIWQTHPMVHPVMRRQPHISQVIQPGGFCHVNLDGAYENSAFRTTRHLYDLFLQAANVQLARMGINLGLPINCRPRLIVPENVRQAARSQFLKYPKPWVFVCPRSDYYAPRQVPDGIWDEAAKAIKGTKFWIGLHPAPKSFVDLQCRTLNTLIDWMTCADLLITVDTGPMHIANALGIQVLAIGQSSSPELHLGDQTDFLTIQPKLDCLNCQKNVCPKNASIPPCQNVDPALISEWANRQLEATQSEKISCVIPILKPKAQMLNRCIECVLPQVDEIVTTRELGGIVPLDVVSHPKLRHVVKNLSKIGFGRNVNFGVRHTSGKYVLVLNDDVYLAPDAVSRMMDCMKPKTGVVGQLLRYPNGKIYHAGKQRPAGPGIGFPHLDHMALEPRIKEPLEMENTNGASFLFRREAFYAADGYDEGFEFYAEDDDICMKIRKAGWQVWYTPLATGIHDEHQESKQMPDRMMIMARSNARFAAKWRDYFTSNINTRPLGNFKYLER